MRYFVTGATGFIGGHLVRQLIDAGHEVDIIARDPGKAGERATCSGSWRNSGSRRACTRAPSGSSATRRGWLWTSRTATTARG
ncbi:MAG: NAD(P)-dependent oxidoreductase [Methanobacteriota archaeon]|nr:MAG: NAD(P)-dependent oxidoreductase [Euryarchaeota archaeon]